MLILNKSQPWYSGDIHHHSLTMNLYDRYIQLCNWEYHICYMTMFAHEYLYLNVKTPAILPCRINFDKSSYLWYMSPPASYSKSSLRAISHRGNPGRQKSCRRGMQSVTLIRELHNSTHRGRCSTQRVGIRSHDLILRPKIKAQSYHKSVHLQLARGYVHTPGCWWSTLKLLQSQDLKARRRQGGGSSSAWNTPSEHRPHAYREQGYTPAQSVVGRSWAWGMRGPE